MTSPTSGGASEDVLLRLGWSPAVAEALVRLSADGAEPGRIVRIDRGRARVETRAGEVRPHIGKQEVAVGDWVAVDATPGSERIVGVAERTSAIRRQAAGEDGTQQLLVANVDTVFLVISLETDINVRRLERALAMAWSSGAEPVIVLTKADAADDMAAAIADVRGVAPEVDIVATSKITRVGLDELHRWIRSRPDGSVPTVALLGASGAGKSTLVNELSGAAVMATATVRDHDAKGRHTTTHRRLVELPDGGLLIDTPGLRSVGLWDAADGVERTFADIGNLAAECRFNDCAHSGEPGCAVSEAMASGDLAPERLQAWRDLQAEVAEMQRRRDAAEAAARRRRRTPR